LEEGAEPTIIGDGDDTETTDAIDNSETPLVE
jgi:hypothetical protein